MKNLLFILALLPIIIYAQNDCTGYSGKQVFQANKIGGMFYPNGVKFSNNSFNTSDGYFKAPYTSENSPSTIYASAPWIGGYKNGELKLAGTSFGFDSQDYYTGPLRAEAATYPFLCGYFDHIWSVSRRDIEAHIADASDGSIEDTLPSIFGWPAEGNIFFEQFNSFALPTDHNGGWADFDDLNSNGIYEPHLGEYPHIRLKGVAYIPEQIMWMLFNDQGIHEQSNGDPLGIEIQLTVYGFHCQNNSVLNTTLFNTYKIINQDAIKLDSLYFGMWTDYDLGCSYDDYIGSDSMRSTEFIYNDEIDGDTDGGCATHVESYSFYPPVQSMTYLSHPMNSFLADGLHPANHDITPKFPEESYTLLTGNWIDGTPITPDSNGYNPGYPGGTTHFLYHGDPRDSLQWSWYQESIAFGDPRTVSSVYLNTLAPNESAIVETAYMFHQDSSLNHLEQVGFMYANIDSLLKIISDADLSCVRFPICDDKDCVWPGDFNHNGKADHFDVLYWGVMKDRVGAKRNGLINWDGYFADPWSLELPDDLNSKHGDGNGDGHVDMEDLDRNTKHFSLTNPYYQSASNYPPGPHLVLSAQPINENGEIRNFRIKAGIELHDVLGLAYEIEFDTSLFTFEKKISFCPADSNFLIFTDEEYEIESSSIQFENAYSCVNIKHQTTFIDQGFVFQRDWPGLGLKLRPELSPADIPDSTIIRLKNLIALDAEGNDLHIGSEQLVVYREGIVGIHDPSETKTEVYPNPTDDNIQIESAIETEAQLYSLQGQMVRHLSSSELESPVDLSSLPAGMYILRILATGESIKLIIQ